MKYLIVVFTWMLWIDQSCVSHKQTSVSQINLSSSDTTLFRIVQQQTFQYFWDGAEPTSGMARERFHEDNIYPANDKNVITSGGSGFGIMAILVGVERNFITRQQATERFEKILNFLE